jgi:hypothetical protein
VSTVDSGRDSIPSQGNPIITHNYTADPTAIVHEGRVYLYTGHDEAPAGAHEYVMNEWLCWRASPPASPPARGTTSSAISQAS